MPPSKGLTQPLVNAKKTKDIFERKEDRGRKELVMNFDVFMTISTETYLWKEEKLNKSPHKT